MNSQSFISTVLLAALLCIVPACNREIKISADLDSPMVAFGMAELEKAANITSTPIPRIIINRSDTIGSQAFRMVLKNKRAVELRGGDEAGIMYGLLDLADQIRYSDLETGVGESQGNPFIERRGLKFNIPLDATLELVINDIELVKTIQP